MEDKHTNSAQPSPAGQGIPLAMVGDNLRSIVHLCAVLAETINSVTVANIHTEARHALQLLDLAALQPVGATVRDSLNVGGGEAVAASIPEGWVLVDLSYYAILPQIPSKQMIDVGWPSGELISEHFDSVGAFADLIAEHEAKGEGIIHGPSRLPAQAVDQAKPDPTLLEFYQVTDYPTLVAALESHVLKLIDACERNVKPWEDTFPPTLLPKWQREQRAQAVDLCMVRELLQRRASQWRSHLPDAPNAPGTRLIQTDGEDDYNNDVRIYREGIAVMDEVLALIDSQEMGREPNTAPNRLTDTAPAIELGTGIQAITAERQRQLRDEGFSREGDQQYHRGELAKAATAYVQLAAMDLAAGGTRGHIAWQWPAAVWPWEPESWKPVDARRDLVRAGALIAAQIDLIDSRPGANG